MPIPRLPLNGVSGLNVHSVDPVAGSSAMMTPAVVTTNILPSLTMGVASARSGVSTIHAPPSCLTVCVLMRASVEYRVLPQSPAGAGQSRPEYSGPADRIETAAAATRAAPAMLPPHQRHR